ncbi:MAG: L,D-transpeptidase [Acidimicrobiales bacterium]|nr:L,D-transpeptidase [Acidimicrobiales bacterium]
MSTRARLATGAIVAALAVIGGLVAWRSADGGTIAVAASAEVPAPGLDVLSGEWPTTTTAPPDLGPDAGITVSEPIGPPWPTEFTVADAVSSEIPIFEEPGVQVATGRTLPNPTVEGYRLVMLVREEQDEWLKVQINSRPNGATTWIRRSDVELRTVPFWILIERGAKRLTVFHGDDEEVFSTSVAPGKDATPTPLGFFYVDILTRPTNPNGPYGAFQISVTGFSEVYDSFAGGIGQIAIHGTNRPELIGTPASNGCVRMSNEDVSTLVRLARQGTPVWIVA